MPKSRVRRKVAFTPPPTKSPAKLHSRAWVAPVMLALFLIGLLWIVTFYVTGAEYPIGDIGNWNIAIGFAMIAAGFVIATQWR